MQQLDPLIPENAHRIVIVAPSWVGDTVMMTPVLRALRKHRPGASIAVVARPPLVQLLDGCPWIDSVTPCAMKGAAGVFRLASAIRAQKPDAALLLPNSFRSALGARLRGAGRRIGYDRDGRGLLLTDRVKVQHGNHPVSTILYYRHLTAAALGIDDEAIDPRMELHVTPAQHEAADTLLRDVDPTRPLIVLNPGGVRENKRWPAEHFAKAADALASKLGAQCAVTGSPGERDTVDAVVRRAQSTIVNLQQRGVTLGSLKSVLKRASLLITNDTGPRHMALALGTPVVTLFGPTDHRWTTLPGHEQDEIKLLAEPFLPEELVADKYPRTCLIDRIRVGDVVRAATQLLVMKEETGRV